MSIDQKRVSHWGRRHLTMSAVAVVAVGALSTGLAGGAAGQSSTAAPAAAEQDDRIVAAELAPIGVTILPADFPNGVEQAPAVKAAAVCESARTPSEGDRAWMELATAFAMVGVTILPENFPACAELVTVVPGVDRAHPPIHRTTHRSRERAKDTQTQRR
jgi:hypothetical protein